jgi:hypothetical protein
MFMFMFMFTFTQREHASRERIVNGIAAVAPITPRISQPVHMMLRERHQQHWRASDRLCHQ